MRLLFITQKLHGQDAFGMLWVREFMRQGCTVTVVCLEGTVSKVGKGGRDSFEFPALSLGKEKGVSRLQSVLTFEKIIVTETYDRVFVHMAPVWYTLGCWWWTLRRIPTYLWYTHYKMQSGVRLFGWFGTRFFCATPQSLPQYQSSPKKTVVGHGIDLSVWMKRRNLCQNPYRLLVVHRLSRSKRLELSIKALLHLDPRFTLDVYGIEAEPDYVTELRALITSLKLGSRITFHGTVPMTKLPEMYTRHRLILNMASETIDKTMLEAMTCGCFPVTTKANAEAIGLEHAPETDTPEAIAAFVREHAERVPVDADEMYRIVAEGHSLTGLIENMGRYMREGE